MKTAIANTLAFAGTLHLEAKLASRMALQAREIVKKAGLTESIATGLAADYANTSDQAYAFYHTIELNLYEGGQFKISNEDRAMFRLASACMLLAEFEASTTSTATDIEKLVALAKILRYGHNIRHDLIGRIATWRGGRNASMGRAAATDQKVKLAFGKLRKSNPDRNTASMIAKRTGMNERTVRRSMERQGIGAAKKIRT